VKHDPADVAAAALRKCDPEQQLRALVNGLGIESARKSQTTGITTVRIKLKTKLGPLELPPKQPPRKPRPDYV